MVLFLQNIARWLDRLVALTMVLLLAAMLIVTSAGVFWRYGLNAALSWSEELSRFLLVWASFLGAALATYRGAHISINVVYDRLSCNTQLWLARIVDCLIVVFMGAIVVGSVKLLPLLHIRTAPTLFITMDIPYMIIPISAGIIIFQLVVRLLTGATPAKEEH
jgi:TRAP-type transport system small permease protein